VNIRQNAYPLNGLPNVAMALLKSSVIFGVESKQVFFTFAKGFPCFAAACLAHLLIFCGFLSFLFSEAF